MGAGILEGVRAAAPEVGGLLAVVALVAVLAWLGRRQDLRRARADRQAATVRRWRRGYRMVLLAGPPDPWLPPPADPWPDDVDDLSDDVLLTLLDVSPAGVW